MSLGKSCDVKESIEIGLPVEPFRCCNLTRDDVKLVVESGLNQKVLLDHVERVELVGEGEDEVRRRPKMDFINYFVILTSPNHILT